MSEWIPNKGKVPDKCLGTDEEPPEVTTVRVKFRNGKTGGPYPVFSRSGNLRWSFTDFDFDITHWMPA